MRHFSFLLLLLSITALGCDQSESESASESTGDHEHGEHATGDEHSTTGEIKAIDGERIDIAHEDIPGFMPAMQMPFFTNADSTVPDGLAVGDRIEFTFTPQEGGRMVIRTVTKL